MILELQRCSRCGQEGGICLDKIPLFDSLDPRQKALILSRSHHRTVEKGDFLYHPGDAGNRLYIINSGEVKISKLSPAGKEQILHILGAREILGEHALFSSEPLQNTAQALSRTHLCIIHGEEVKGLILEHPEIGLKILEQYARKNLDILRLVESMGLYDVEQRLARFLLDEMEKTGDGRLRLSFSKGTLASLLGTSQETLSRKLSLLQESGILQLKGQREIRVMDPDALRAILDRDGNA